MQSARLRLAALWLSQAARIMADNCLRMAVVMQAAASSALAGELAWNLAAALFVLPALLFAPFNGAIGNSFPKRNVIVLAAAYCLAATVLFSIANTAWLACLAVVAIGNAVYSPARYAMLPAAASDAHWPLSRINGWFEMGAVSAFVAGILLGGYLQMPASADAGVPATALPAFAVAISLMNLIGLIAAMPVTFPSDVYRPESAAAAVRGFFHDVRRIWNVPQARSAMLGVAALRGILLAATGPVIAINLNLHFDGRGPESGFAAMLPYVFMVLIGAAAGALLASVQGHPTRVLGLVPFALTGLFLALLTAAFLPSIPSWIYFAVGVMGGLANVPLFSTYQAALPADARGNGLAVLNAAGYACMTALTLLLAGLSRWQVLGLQHRLWLIVLLVFVGAAIAWKVLLRDAYDQTIEFLFWPIYRIRGFGPGLEQTPRSGPLLVIANHSAWFDPVWLGKVLPRHLIGMLTSDFYDKPFLHFLAKYVVHCIRVEASVYRREAPELVKAIEALDRGECVLIFPEGQMRKKEAVPLRRFGRGVWQMLSERPQTPVVVCWIEGGWGSYASYWNAPPTRNKKFDFWWPIKVAVAAPEVLDARLLVDHHTTRKHLMNRCLEARQILGLPPLPDASLESN